MNGPIANISFLFSSFLFTYISNSDYGSSVLLDPHSPVVIPAPHVDQFVQFSSFISFLIYVLNASFYNFIDSLLLLLLLLSLLCFLLYYIFIVPIAS